MTLVPHLFHIAAAADWEDALTAGSYERSTRGRSLADVGFVHLSFVWQVERVANVVHGDDDTSLVLLRVDPDRLHEPLRIETLDDYPERFPHLYGPLPVDAVVEVRPLERLEGSFRLPDGWRLPEA